MKSYVKIPILFIFFLLGCNTLDTNISELQQRSIILGSGIDGVIFGDSCEGVKAKLGIPDRTSIADGLYGSWFVYDYLEGSHAGLSIYFLEDPINEIGPVDYMTIRPPYSGKTKMNIGIDTPVNEVRLAYGEPEIIYDNYSSEQGIYTYIYCIERKRLQVTFKNDRIEGMGLGYLKLPPNYECK